jgi:hypothetical protein
MSAEKEDDVSPMLAHSSLVASRTSVRQRRCQRHNGATGVSFWKLTSVILSRSRATWTLMASGIGASGQMSAPNIFVGYHPADDLERVQRARSNMGPSGGILTTQCCCLTSRTPR